VAPLISYNGKLLTVNGKLASDLSCCSPCTGTPRCPCPQHVSWGNNTQELTFTLNNNIVCSKCMSNSVFNYLNRLDISNDPNNPCLYEAEYDLYFENCYPQSCKVMVTFFLSNFPDCDCQGTGDHCDYSIVSWRVTLGTCQVIDITAGNFC